jgi:hypothetical protein
MIVQRMRNAMVAAWAAVPALAALTLITGLAATAPASASASTPAAFLASVSCTSSPACIAVGGRAGHDQRDQIFNLSWNGRRWTPQVPVDGNHTQPNDLNSIACASATECFAVGSVGNFNVADHRRLIEEWNGTAWSILALGNPKGTANDFLNSVSCGGPTLCFAVGDEDDNTDLPVGPLVEKWNGTNWAVQPPLPEPAGAVAFSVQAVACVSPADCTAVGSASFKDFTDQQTLAEHWNGTSWSLEPMPTLSGSTEPELFSVSCSGATCMAAGNMFGPGAGDVPLAEFFNGTSWSVVNLATPAGSTGVAVNGVACTSVTNCYAVGVTGASAQSAVTLIEQWNGTTWAVVPSPNAAGTNTLQAVSCASGQSCMAVGRSSQGSSLSTLAMQLSGGHWSITPTPSPG